MQDWNQIPDDFGIIINAKDYNPAEEKRLLIPFTKETGIRIPPRKYGLLNSKGQIILEAEYDVILDECLSRYDIIRVGRVYSFGFARKNGNVDTYIGFKYKAVKAHGTFVTKEEYDRILVSDDNMLLTVFDREKGYAVIDRDGHLIVPFGEYHFIDGFDQGLSRVRHSIRLHNRIADRWGLINARGDVILPLEFEEIWNFYGKNMEDTRVKFLGEYHYIQLYERYLNRLANKINHFNPNSKDEDFEKLFCDGYDDYDDYFDRPKDDYDEYIS